MSTSTQSLVEQELPRTIGVEGYVKIETMEDLFNTPQESKMKRKLNI